jgi:hypothetical protein
LVPVVPAITQAMTEAFKACLSTVMTTEDGPRGTSRKKYTMDERAVILSLLTQYEGEETELPQFFKGLEEPRSSKSKTRCYIEQALASQMVQGISYPVVGTNLTVQSIMKISFGAQDLMCHWKLRKHGLTPFAWAPCRPGNAADAIILRERFVRYEDTAANRTNAEAEQRAAQADSSGEQFPLSQERAAAWVDNDIKIRTAMFGEDLQVLPYLRRIRELLQRAELLALWRPEHYATFMWRYHHGIRRTLLATPSLGFIILDRVRDALAGQEPISFELVPMDVAQVIKSAVGIPDGNKQPWDTPSKSENERSPKRQRTGTKAPEFIQRRTKPNVMHQHHQQCWGYLLRSARCATLDAKPC